MSDSSPELLPYDAPLGSGQVRTYRPDAENLVIEVGPLPLFELFVAIAPIALVFGFFSVWEAVLAYFILHHRAAIPLDTLVAIPSTLLWLVCGVELVMQFRGWSRPIHLVASRERLSFPYPTPRSANEDLPAGRIVRIETVVRRTAILRRRRPAMELELYRGPTFTILRGYATRTLDEVSDLLGSAMGMTPVDDANEPGA